MKGYTVLALSVHPSETNILFIFFSGTTDDSNLLFGIKPQLLVLYRTNRFNVWIKDWGSDINFVKIILIVGEYLYSQNIDYKIIHEGERNEDKRL